VLSGFIDYVYTVLESGSLIVFIWVFLLGVITSLSPCVLSILPIMVGYIGSREKISRLRGFFLSLQFVLGMAITLTILALVAASFGRIFEQAGSAWYYVLAAVAIIMGLNLLDVIPIRFPTLKKMPAFTGTFYGTVLMGMAFGLVMSPCTTPVLAVLLAYAAARGEVLYSMGLLFFYGLGHGMILLAAGTFTSVLTTIPAIRSRTGFINKASGILLILAGLYFLTLTW
jgi:cytochrome c-type biogenesis protein